MRCGTITYAHTLVCPVPCPFCLGDGRLPAYRRLESWTRDHKLWSHVNDHLEVQLWPLACPHTLCDTSIAMTRCCIATSLMTTASAGRPSQRSGSLPSMDASCMVTDWPHDRVTHLPTQCNSRLYAAGHISDVDSIRRANCVVNT